MARLKTPTKILEFKGAYKKDPQRRREGEPKPYRQSWAGADALGQDSAKGLARHHPAVSPGRDHSDGPGRPRGRRLWTGLVADG